MKEHSNKHSKTCGRWTKEEHFKFLQGLRIYGKNWKKIEQLLPNRSGSQIRSHAQKFFLKTKDPQATNDHSQFLPQTGDSMSQPQQTTLNSKSQYEWQLYPYELSYYLNKIIQFSTVKGECNFWGELVDYQRKNSNQKHVNKCNSFMTFIKQQTCNKIQSGYRNQIQL